MMTADSRVAVVVSQMRGAFRQHIINGALGPTLAKRGLLLIGLDVIGDWLTEVNVTSPTCFREIEDQTKFDVADLFIAALESRIP